MTYLFYNHYTEYYAAKEGEQIVYYRKRTGCSHVRTTYEDVKAEAWFVFNRRNKQRFTSKDVDEFLNMLTLMAHFE